MTAPNQTPFIVPSTNDLVDVRVEYGTYLVIQKLLAKHVNNQVKMREKMREKVRQKATYQRGAYEKTSHDWTLNVLNIQRAPSPEPKIYYPPPPPPLPPVSCAQEAAYNPRADYPQGAMPAE